MPLFEDETLEGAIRKATAGLRPDRKQEDNLPMNRGFGTHPKDSRISGTGQSGFGSIDNALDGIASGFERLARQHYPNQAAAFDQGRTNRHLMIPELSANIYATADRNGRVTYGYSNFVAGTGDPRSGTGSVQFTRRSTTVAFVHAHWIDTNASDDQSFGRMGISEYDETDEDAARSIRDDHGDQMRFFVYQ